MTMAKKKQTVTGADEWEHATPILSHGILQTDLFLVYLFFCERKAVPVLRRSDVNWFLVICHGIPSGVSFQENSI